MTCPLPIQGGHVTKRRGIFRSDRSQHLDNWNRRPLSLFSDTCRCSTRSQITSLIPLGIASEELKHRYGREWTRKVAFDSSYPNRATTLREQFRHRTYLKGHVIRLIKFSDTGCKVTSLQSKFQIQTKFSLMSIHYFSLPIRRRRTTQIKSECCYCSSSKIDQCNEIIKAH